jgi:hypothetical protein
VGAIVIAMAFSYSANGKDSTPAPEVEQSEVTDDSFSDSLETAIVKRIEKVRKESEFTKLKTTVDAKLPLLDPPTPVIEDIDPRQYKPLFDEDPALVESNPPFAHKN